MRRSTPGNIGGREADLEAPLEDAEIGQISFYLAKPALTFDEVIDWESDLRERNAYSNHSFRVEDHACRFLYFESITTKKTPAWLEFINAQLADDEQKSLAAIKSPNANGILGIEIAGRWVLSVFGRSAGTALNRKSIERDFGIKTAMNMCGNEEIRQTHTHSNSLVPTSIARQVSRPSDAFSFALSDGEDLKFISAHIKGEQGVTLQGRDHLTIKILGREKLSWVGLVKRCRAFLDAYDRNDYVDLFPNYRNFQPAPEEKSLLLDKILLATLKERRFDDVQLWVPEFIPNDEYSFSYSDNAKNDNNIYAYLDTEQLADEVGLNNLTLEGLRKRRIFAYSHSEERVISQKWWYLYDCLIFESALDDEYYVLSDGEWKIVSRDFRQAIETFVKTHVREEACEQEYKNIAIGNVAEMKNKEELFNQEVCKRRPTAILFDQAKLRVGTGRKDKEFCDILDLTDDGTMRIINCKPLKGSSAVTYLFAQTRFYCEGFLRDETFLRDIRERIAASTSATRDKYLNHIKPDLKDVLGSDYRVCVWLLCDNRKALPSKHDLPLIAQFELKLMSEHLQHVCKFKDIVLRFIPVSQMSFKRAKAPRKAN
ncbi:hypothetical protein IZ6_10880 [Terrihabitans soli]|uniref:Sporadically distributed protein, TIGR04141 family n=1 Tax=Terrihabitans soli TaxID=708113 RepID=A0A6S6QGT2_9HYPH|nr:DUF6119 family protein [Terrihabitans soli]BCJ90353.1 hypothetical protein IZ6_10880 [Terrihabitans soli]